MRYFRTLIAVLMVALAGCTSAQPAPVTTTGPPTRDCARAVYGDLVVDPNSIVVGPLTFVGLGSAKSFDPVPAGQSTGTVKALILLAAGASVTVAIGADAVGHVGLLYDRAVEDDAPVSAGIAAITLVACADRTTQFNGGFILDGPRCVPLDLRFPPSTAAPERLDVGFGMSC